MGNQEKNINLAGDATPLAYTAENLSNKSTNTSLGMSDALYPSQNAVKTYVDTAIATPTSVTLTPSSTINIDISLGKNFLLTSSAATVTYTFTNDTTDFNINLVVTLNATSSIYTFPVTSLCINSDNTASGDNTCTLSGTSGDTYILTIKKISTKYWISAQNFKS